MKKTVGRLAAATGVSAALLVGCNCSPAPEQFIGTWHRVKYPTETVTVTKKAERTLVFVARDYTSGEPLVGKLIGDQVVIDAMTTATLRANGNLVYAGREYIR
ncbi:hypothetical protein [Variovorax sp. KK3]|uniref:hypothetical protein n=1 Tax=Variovorax sp. KK3 TaxID=1855728 RepID=UPI00117CA357|nr:hypothetical protein [Variovorax sp. KK3]